MRQIVFLFFLIAFNSSLISQNNTCNSDKQESLIDLNSITKCTVNHSKKSKDKKARQISVRVSAPKRRFLKKRIAKKSEASGINGIETSGVINTAGNSSDLSKSLTLKSNVANITNTLSAEEVKKAEKFSTVDNIPHFEGCKGANDDEKLDCFNSEMIKHIQKHFNYPHEAIVNKIQGDVWVRFIIDKNGNISNIKALGPKNAKVLNDEAIRVVSLLPKFVPATKNSKKTSVKYGFPISFSLDEN